MAKKIKQMYKSEILDIMCYKLVIKYKHSKNMAKNKYTNH